MCSVSVEWQRASYLSNTPSSATRCAHRRTNMESHTLNGETYVLSDHTADGLRLAQKVLSGSIDELLVRIGLPTALSGRRGCGRRWRRWWYTCSHITVTWHGRVGHRPGGTGSRGTRGEMRGLSTGCVVDSDVLQARRHGYVSVIWGRQCL